jgi:hypothetical protein
MGILNIDEHVEEHRLMAIRYPDKAVIPGQSVIAQSNIPFLIMPGDGGANGCSFSGTAGAFTLSAAILANIYVALTGCYAYFSANFGGSTLPDRVFIRYGRDRLCRHIHQRHAAKACDEDADQRKSDRTNYRDHQRGYGPAGFSVAGLPWAKMAAGLIVRYAGSTAGTKLSDSGGRTFTSVCRIVAIGAAASPISESLHKSKTLAVIARSSGGPLTSGANRRCYGRKSLSRPSIVSFDTIRSVGLVCTLQRIDNHRGACFAGVSVTATYGE